MIWKRIKDRINDNTATVVFISPGMKELGKKEKLQWIPQEISYSIKEMPRNDRISHSNSLLFATLPDKNDQYVYFDKINGFKIIEKNIQIFM